MIKEKTLKLDICQHYNQIINFGYSWCGLKDENGKQKHPKCECENCPDKEPCEAIITYTTTGENNDSNN